MSEKRNDKHSFIFNKNNLFAIIFIIVFFLVGIVGLIYKGNTQKKDQIAQGLLWAVKETLLSEGSLQYEGDIPVTGYTVIAAKEIEEIIYVYTVSSFCNYKTDERQIVSGLGYSCVPTVFSFIQRGSRYEFQDSYYPVYGDGYVKSLKSLFAGDLYGQLLNMYYTCYEDIANQQKTYLEKYITDYNEDSDSDETTERQPLTSAIVQANEPLPLVNASLIALLSSDFAMYPPFVGERSVVISGEGVVLKVSFLADETTAQKGTYILTKSINGVISEAHRIHVTKDTAAIDETYIYSKPEKTFMSTEPIYYVQNEEGIIAFSYQEANNNFSLYIQTEAGQKAIFSASEGYSAVFPMVSPTEPVVAFINAKAAGEECGFSGELTLYNYEKGTTANTGINIICDSEIPCGYEFISDGRVLVKNGYLTSSPNKAIIGFYDIKTATMTNIAKEDENPGRASISPDERLLLYTNYNRTKQQKELIAYYVYSGDKKVVLTEEIPEVNTSISFPTYSFVDTQHVLTSKTVTSAAEGTETVSYHINMLDVVTLEEQQIIENGICPYYDEEENAVYYVDAVSLEDIYRYDMKTGLSRLQENMQSPFNAIYD